MENFPRILSTQMVLLVYLTIGIYYIKAELIDRETKEKLVDIILRTTLPCMILNSFNELLTPEVLIQTALIPVVTVAVFILSFLLEKVIYNKYPQEKKSTLQYCTLVSNLGFLGILMVSAVYGSGGFFVASTFIVPSHIFMRTVGLAMSTITDFRTKCRNTLLNSCIITVSLDIVHRMTGFPVPGFLGETIANIGTVTALLPMMTIGIVLIRVPWRKSLEPSIFYLTFVHPIALPLVVLLILDLIYAEPMLADVFLILTGMPVESTSTLLAAKYGMDEDYAPRCVVTTTIMSLATVSALVLLL